MTTTTRSCCLASGFPPFDHSIDCAQRERKPVSPTDRTAPCSDNSPSWFTGHWRDWHRGHGCDRDDGKPRSETAIAEVAQHEANTAAGYLTDAELRFLRASTTSGNDLLVRALDELATRRSAATREAPFNHSQLATKHFEPLLGYCVCVHCTKLPTHDPTEAAR